MQELTQFDTAKKEVAILTQKLEGCIVTSPETRESLFSDARDANRIRKLIDNKRLELTEPYRTAKTNLIKQHKDEKSRLDAEILKIDTYAKFDIAGPLETAISTAKTSILYWDGEQAKIKAAEEKRLENERIKIELAAKKAEDEAKEKSGIAAKLALKKAEEKKVENLEIVRTEEATLNTKKKGREVEVITWGVIDISIVPDRLLDYKINTREVDRMINEGERDIPGIKIEVTKELKFQ